MKKIALAVGAALLAVPAMAANVELYGRVDTGLSYTNERAKIYEETTASKSFSLDSGNSTGSRWGLKGTEDLGNGYKVGFVLESAFSSDTGAGKSKLFHREAAISVSGSFGTIYAGRLGSLLSDAGSAGWFGSMASAFGTGWGEIAGHAAVMSVDSRRDNTLIYMSPRFGGLQLSAQYSMGDDGSENKAASDRYAAIGVDYQAGKLEVAALFDYTNKSTKAYTVLPELNPHDYIDDTAWTANLAASYDCGFAKSFAAVQYFKNTNDFTGLLDAVNKYGMDLSDPEIVSFVADNFRSISLKGFGINLSTDIPAFGGNFMVSAGYMDADVRYEKSKTGTLKGFTALAGYTYPLSKRTSVYAGAGWTKYKYDIDLAIADDCNKKVFQAMAGLVHKF